MAGSDFLRSTIRSMAGYAPGEQPLDDGTVKLNTNENPYPPSPRVFAAIQASLTGNRLRKYPDPTGRQFRQAAGRVLKIDPDSILIGNGSDDILTILSRAFVPEGGLMVSLTPSYILYRTLAQIQGARFEAVPFTPNWDLPMPWPIQGANLTWVANPNSPSGTCVNAEALAELLVQSAGALVIDEAYVDFADHHCLHLASRPGIIVTRSFSKSYSLAGIRFGYAVADPELVRHLIKVKDSYNCDALSLEAARAAIEDVEYLQATRAKIVATRTRLAACLVELGFGVTPSAANFVWAQWPGRPLKLIDEELKKRKILVRYMHYDGYGEGLRISVGADSEIDLFLNELGRIV